MEDEKRLEKAEEIMNTLDWLNDFEYIYCEGEDEYLESIMTSLTGVKPTLWGEKNGNRQQCYSNMLCKLLLAYLISEIKKGCIFEPAVLNEIKDMRLDTFSDFFYDDCGYETSSVLENLVEKALCFCGYYKCYTEFIDTTDCVEAKDTGISMEKRLIASIIKTFPKLEPYIGKNYMDFYGICECIEECEEFGVELVIVESSVLYEIRERESRYPTKLGKEILKFSDIILKRMLQEDYLYMGLQWEIVDKRDKKLYFCGVTCPDVYGDNAYWNVYAMDRLHKYNYRNILPMLSMQKKIGEYQNLYLKN